MSSRSLVFLDAATLDRGDLDFQELNRFGKATLYPTTKPDQTLGRIKEADIVLTNKVVLDAKILSQTPRLRLIAVCATGTNNIDLVAAKKHGVGVVNVAGYGSFAVAQHTMALILNWATQIHRLVREPQAWSLALTYTRLDYPVFELAGRSLGLVGTGKIGQEVGRLASAFGMKVRAWDRPQTEGETKREDPWPRLPLRQLFEISDVVSLHCPLTEVTRHIISRESLSWMKPGSFLVNTGRGDLVDEEALKDALVSGKLGGAALDVLSVEPPPANHPLLCLNLPNLLITPHTAWSAQEARKRLWAEVVLNIEVFLKGEKRNRLV